MLRPLVLAASVVVVVSGCTAPVDGPRAGAGDSSGEATAPAAAPQQFTIVPDDYHVPYAGTAGDGRKFFLSDELFSSEPGKQSTGYVGLFLWNADGSFSGLRVDPVQRADGVPPGQAVSAGADQLLHERLAELGHCKLESITVQPFTRKVDGVTFGWSVTEYEGTFSINIEPGDFIAYYEPWDGLDYDT